MDDNRNSNVKELENCYLYLHVQNDQGVEDTRLGMYDTSGFV